MSTKYMSFMRNDMMNKSLYISNKTSDFNMNVLDYEHLDIISEKSSKILKVTIDNQDDAKMYEENSYTDSKLIK